MSDCVLLSIISILSLYAEGDLSMTQHNEYSLTISILSLYAEGDAAIQAKDTVQTIFQSSPSMQRETLLLC